MQRIYFTGDGDTSKAQEATLELTADMSNDDCAEISHRGSEEKHRDRIGHSSRIAPGSHVFLRSRRSEETIYSHEGSYRDTSKVSTNKMQVNSSLHEGSMPVSGNSLLSSPSDHLKPPPTPHASQMPPVVMVGSSSLGTKQTTPTAGSSSSSRGASSAERRAKIFGFFDI
ncbi:hypothetical protein ACOSP7_004001 [Xanthoceras sorbifolium]